MTIIECKNCGAKVALPYNQTFATCEYCGSIVTPAKDEPELSGTAGNINSLLKRIHLFLEDGKWDSAKEYCEKVLDIDPECAQAYLYRLMAICNIDKPQKLVTRSREISEMDDYQKALRFATPEFRKTLEELSLNNLYYLAKTIMDTAQTEAQYKKAAVKFKKISTWKDSENQSEKCLELAEITGKDTAYNEASTLMTEADFKKTFINEFDRIIKLEKAIELFATIPEWKDADSLKAECERMLEISIEKETQDKLEQAKIDEVENLKTVKRKKSLKISAWIIVSIFMIYAFINQMKTPDFNSNKSQTYVEIPEEDTETNDSLKEHKQSCKQRLEFLEKMTIPNSIAAGKYHTVGLKNDGTVLATGRQKYGACNVNDWSDITSIAAGDHHTVGLKKDGTVLAAGDNSSNQCNVEEWNGIAAIAAGAHHTLGLKEDGTVLATGDNSFNQCDVETWNDIIKIFTSENCTIGIQSDGTLLTTGNILTKWRFNKHQDDIVTISITLDNAFALKSNGQVIEAENTDTLTMFHVNYWRDIISISTGFDFVVALNSHGKIYVTGFFGEQNFNDWDNIVAIVAGGQHTIGLKSDGTILATGYNDDGQCNVSDWTDIRLPQ